MNKGLKQLKEINELFITECYILADEQKILEEELEELTADYAAMNENDIFALKILLRKFKQLEKESLSLDRKLRIARDNAVKRLDRKLTELRNRLDTEDFIKLNEDFKEYIEKNNAEFFTDYKMN